MAAENFFGPAYYGDPGVPHANPDEFSTIAMATALYLGVKHVLKFKAKLWTKSVLAPCPGTSPHAVLVSPNPCRLHDFTQSAAHG